MDTRIDQEVIPPGYMQQGEDVIKGTEAEPSGMHVSSLRFKGYVRVWDTKTGVESLQPWWVLWQTMTFKHPDGTLMYTRVNPRIPQNHGEDLFCPLNPDSPEHALLAGKGFKPCRKRHIPHQDAVSRHVLKSHKRAHAAIERDRVDRQRAEDRAIQMRAIETNERFMETLLGRAVDTAVPEAQSVTIAYSTDGVAGQDAPLYVSDKPKPAARRRSKPKKT